MNRTFALTDAANVVYQLTLAYGQPYGLSPGASEDLAKQWAKVLDDCDPRDVHEVVDRWTKQHQKWPSASKVREEALKLAATQRAKPASYVEGEFCPRCHTRDLIPIGRAQRLMPLHRDDCPGLHEHDRTEQTAALNAGIGIWPNGKPSEDETHRMSLLRRKIAQAPQPAQEATTP